MIAGRHSAVALDIYCWLARRLHRIPAGRPQLVPWVGLQEQFGQGYARIRRFREFIAGLLPQIRAAYPDARFDTDGRGMTLFQSLVCLTAPGVQAEEHQGP